MKKVLVPVIRVEKDGFEKITSEKSKVLSGWFLGNLLLGGLIGGTVDLVTHNQGHYPTDPIFIKLVPTVTKTAEK